MDCVAVFSLRAVLYTLYIHNACCTIARFTYEIAPVFVLMEQLTLKKMREMIGWPNGEGDGLFSPGETKGTIMKMGCAFVKLDRSYESNES